VASISAIEEVYRRRYRRFVRVALALTGDAERAHDAVQEAFARAIRGRFGLRDEGSLESWLWRTLANACADDRRALARRIRFAATRDGITLWETSPTGKRFEIVVKHRRIVRQILKPYALVF
jgi:DNA-directed RNA polymerase specialized sigma24 family protein